MRITSTPSITLSFLLSYSALFGTEKMSDIVPETGIFEKKSSDIKSPALLDRDQFFDELAKKTPDKNQKMVNHTEESFHEHHDDTVSSSTQRLLERPWLPSLHIYGGGIRGIIPATLLREFEKITKKQTLDMFEFFSGTSTGGIIAGGITSGLSAGEIVKLYKNNAATIFDPALYYNPSGIRGPQYDINNLRTLMDPFAEGRTLKDLEKDVLIPCFDVRRMRPHIFKSWAAKQNEDHNFWLTDVLSATGAAPTYFSPVQFYNYPSEPNHPYKREFIGVDGGIFDNASTSTAFNSIQELYGTDINHLAVALGTGVETLVPPTFDSLNTMGALGIAPHLINWMLKANVGKTEYEMRQHLKPIGNIQQYYEFNPRIDGKFAAMDSKDSKTLNQLEQYALDLVENESINTTVIQLVRRLEDIREDGLLAQKLHIPAPVKAKKH